MGILSVLFGRKRVPASKTEKLGSIASAELTMRTSLGMDPGRRGGLALRTLGGSRFEQLRSDIDRVLQLAARDLGSEVFLRTDGFGYLWAVITDDDFPDLVAGMQIASQMVAEEGFRDQLLCAVFPFRSRTGDLVHLVYSFRRGSFYAFAPRSGEKRDTALELRVHALLEGELPLERDLEFRYPLWGMPVDDAP